MKLIFCDRCWDVFKLSAKEIRSCECGYCRGKYLPDGGRAITNGHGVALAFTNTSVVRACREIALGGDITCDIKAWARQHDGVNNPRTTIQGDL